MSTEDGPWWPESEADFQALDGIAAAALAEVGLDRYVIRWEVDGSYLVDPAPTGETFDRVHKAADLAWLTAAASPSQETPE
jgi:hypothetical protein